MKQIISAAILFAVIISCNSNTKPGETAKGSANETFQKLSEDYLDGYFAARPLFAVSLGIHEGYDGKTSDYSKVALDAELSRMKNYETQLASIDTASLSKQKFMDYRILLSSIKSEIFNIEDEHTYTHNPMTYAGAVDVNTYVKRDFAPLEERVKYIISTENALPALFAAAKANLEDSMPKSFIEIAIQIAEGLCYLHDRQPKPLVHRDVKSANILLDRQFQVRIGDFGLARLARAEEASTHTCNIIGTSVYMAPEAFKGKQHPVERMNKRREGGE